MTLTSTPLAVAQEVVQSQGALAAAAAPDTPVRDHPPAAPSDVGSDGDSTGSPDSVSGLGPPGAATRALHVPPWISFVSWFCMGAQGA
jgi:hypothetical protein